jgi:hypothetical protein
VAPTATTVEAERCNPSRVRLRQLLEREGRRLPGWLEGLWREPVGDRTDRLVRGTECVTPWRRHRVFKTGAVVHRYRSSTRSPTHRARDRVGDGWEQRFRDREAPTTTRHLAPLR